MPAEVVAGRYELVNELGKGASATVYRAYDQALERDVALKIVSPALANDPDFVSRFQREARLAARMQHPNIVPVHDVGRTEDGRPFIAMTLIEGTGLDAVIRSHGAMALPEAIRVLSELGSALDYLHGQGLVHRDVKPSNTLVEDSGRVMLADFGIAYARESTRYTSTGVMLGTPRYMAPEQMMGGEPGPQTDVYAMGVVAFEMLAGTPPFEGRGSALMYQVAYESAPLITSVAPNLPAAIEPVIAKALAKQPGDRWATPGEFVAALRDATGHGESAVAPIVALPASASGWTAPPAETMAEPLRAGIIGGLQPATDAPPIAPTATAVVEPRSKRRMVLVAAVLGFIGVGAGGFCLSAAGGDPDDGQGIAAPSSSVTTASPAGPSESVTPAATPTQTQTATPAAGPTLPVVAPTNTPPPPAPSPTTPPPTATFTATPTATIAPAAPAAPSNVVFTGGAQSLSWRDNSDNETGFNIYWRARDINTGEFTVEQDGSAGPDTTSAAVPDVFLPAIYSEFTRGVSAYNDVGESEIAWAD